MSKRSIRRHHKQRLTAKAARIFPQVPCPRKYADNRKPCSCLGCKREGSLYTLWKKQRRDERVTDPQIP